MSDIFEVSIIIPCHNAAPYVGAAIESALDQTYAEVEVIVIDDGSTDDSLGVIRSYGDRIRWERTPNRGAPAARNRGLELARGAYVKFLDADDVLLPDCLERQVRQSKALSNNQRAIVYGDALWVDADGNQLTHSSPRPRRADEDPIAHILTQNPLTSCPLHRQSHLHEVGGFDESLARSQEHDLHVRLVLSGISFVHRAGAVYRYSEHGSDGRISGKTYAQQGVMSHYQMIQKHKALIMEQRGQPLSQPVQTALARRLWAHGRGILREGDEQSADRYFDEAKCLAGTMSIVGNAPYPTLARWLGPQRAERITTVLKRVTGRSDG
jgi:glycosyltransferase involved in cell wall biosynthesis